ncbi:minor capsid protein [Aneurinibacillus thermoaerophilus]|uniref:minor capsid protein n=1 Tax=Aneurinibacillus thermoaerophilus TaxID=143495 RepID=UPI002E1BB728|nr:minor capsid protein [Aneurinibacillus thermoaerophilus]MED0679690.1 minor capsid protein [Aneurinibacillus thermoaerophilus]MED0765528.1 minor capsid protein [Aneurinibacillus thermoaerophilus]
MDFATLEKLIIDQRKKLIAYKDSQVRPLLQAYAKLLQQLEQDVGTLFINTNVQGAWDWETIARTQRMEALFLQIEKRLQVLATTTEQGLQTAMSRAITVDYAFAAYITTRALNGITLIPPVIPQQAIQEMLNHPWSGDHFSSRIWHNKDLLKTNLRRELTQSMVLGESVQQTTRRLRDVLETDAYKAERLVRSEIIAAGNRASRAYYERFDAEYSDYDVLGGIKILETLDRKTCAICRSMDGKIIPVSEAKSIKDIEHPNCRRTLAPVINGFSQNIPRAARDENGKYVRTNAKTFKEYAEEYNIPFDYRVA